MNVSIKQVLLVGVGVLLLASLAASAYLFELTQLQATRYGELQSQFKASLDQNKSLSLMVKTLTEEARQAQQAADVLLQAKAERNTVTIQTVTEIKEVLNHEKCADVPIPDAAKWVYYH